MNSRRFECAPLINVLPHSLSTFSALIVSSAAVSNYWYLSKLNRNCLVSVRLPLVSGTNTTMESIWHELPLPKDTSAHGPSSPSTQAHVLMSLRGHLLLVEEHQVYHYDSKFKQWSDCSQLPVAMNAPFCAVLLSGLLLAGDGNTVFHRPKGECG